MDNNNSSPGSEFKLPASIELDPYYSPNTPSLISNDRFDQLSNSAQQDVFKSIFSILPSIDVIQREFGNKLVAQCKEEHAKLRVEKNSEVCRLRSTVKLLEYENWKLQKERDSSKLDQFTQVKAELEENAQKQQLESQIQRLNLANSELRTTCAILESRLVRSELRQQEQMQNLVANQPGIWKKLPRQSYEQQIAEMQTRIASMQYYNSTLGNMVTTKTNLTQCHQQDLLQKGLTLEKTTKKLEETEKALQNEKEECEALNKNLQQLQNENKKLEDDLMEKEQCLEICKGELTNAKKELSEMKNQEIQKIAFTPDPDEKLRLMKEYICNLEQDWAKQNKTLENAIGSGSATVSGTKRKKHDK